MAFSMVGLIASVLLILGIISNRHSEVRGERASTETTMSTDMGTMSTDMGTDIGDLATSEPTSPALESTESESQVRARLYTFAAAVCSDCTQLSTPTLGRLSEFKSYEPQEEISVTLNPGSEHVIVAVCGPIPCDIDLFLVGNPEYKDTDTAPTAIMRFIPASKGVFKIGVRMYACETGVCRYALGIWNH